MTSALITGCSKGIGFATALALGRAGFTVHATMRNPKGSPELAQAAEKERLAIRVFQMDVDSDDSVRNTIQSIQGAHGPVDILINNAGIETSGSIEEIPIANVRAVMETNYFGALRCIQAVMPEMRKRKSGCIVNISSVAGRLSSSPFAAYAASQWALEALSEGLAQEGKVFNIRVAIVEPGIIDTGMARNLAKPPAPSPYPQAERMSAMFAASLQERPTAPPVVAEKILEIIQSGTWKLRHTAGPDADGYLQARASMTDEQWIARSAGVDTDQ
jgi:NAD(P)-dependent dehydrogenase (short-subunit alcohol dehydrogenase family)